MDKQYTELVEETHRLAGETKGPESHVVTALGYQIKAIGELDDQIEALNSNVKALNQSTTKLMSWQIWLIVIQTIIVIFLAVAALKL